MNKVIVSVIVPVYNAEKYLSRCVESLITQSYEDIEIILINDGSKDLSGAKCDAYAEKDIRVRVYHKENGGVSSARNLGIEKALGEYICFADADDWVDRDYVLSMVNALEENTDMIVSNLKTYFNTKIRKNSAHSKYSINSENLLNLDDLFVDGFFILQNFPCSKLFNNYIIKSSNLKFRENLKHGEDFIFSLEYSLKCKNIKLINSYDYNYNRINETSVTFNYFKNHFQELKKMFDVYFEIISNYRTVSKSEKEYKYFYIGSRSVFEECKINNGKTFKEKYQGIKSILSLEEVKNYKGSLEYGADNIMFKVIKVFMRLNQPLLILLFMYIFNYILKFIKKA